MEETLLQQSKIQFANEVKNYYPEILTDEALQFITALHEQFNSKRIALLERRKKQQAIFDEGKFPEFPRETKNIREGDGTLDSRRSRPPRRHCGFRALERFQGAGKPVVAVGDYYTQSQYLLASFADALYMHPMGQLILPGYGGNRLYFKRLLDKLNINIQDQFQCIAKY